jgi:DNA-binding MarR family transcriptional regulator
MSCRGHAARKQVAMNSKALFAAMPARAIQDQKLHGLEWRVLAAVAMHDRMSLQKKAPGKGCIASNATLANWCGCNQTNLSTAISTLVERGYIRREADKSGRNRTLRVLYTEGDAHALLLARACKPSSLGKGDIEAHLPKGKANSDQPLPIGKRTFAEASSSFAPRQTHLCPQESQLPETKDESAHNIFSNKLNISSKRAEVLASQNEKINSAEADQKTLARELR